MDIFAQVLLKPNLIKEDDNIDKKSLIFSCTSRVLEGELNTLRLEDSLKNVNLFHNVVL